MCVHFFHVPSIEPNQPDAFLTRSLAQQFIRNAITRYQQFLVQLVLRFLLESS